MGADQPASTSTRYIMSGAATEYLPKYLRPSWPCQVAALGNNPVYSIPWRLYHLSISNSEV